ncbi:MAG: metallophosphoesterase family protein [Phycisphaerae bacterium]|nr:metallophosphoesterase family protein [Phycisphaerae bacterium]
MKPVPWLAGVTSDSVYACLEATTNATDATVDFGRVVDGMGNYAFQVTTESMQPTLSGRYVHNIPLTGLQPNTQYHYKVTHGSDVSADYTFWTAPLPGTPAKWGFAADCRSNPTLHNTMAGLIAARSPRMMVYGGDLCHSATWDYWDTEWFVANQNALNATTPFVNAVGNHEQWLPLTKAYTESPDGTDGNGEGYFSFDYGDTHILVLNNMVDYSPGSAQWDFAAADLAASTSNWNVVAYHKPAYSAGGDGENAGMIAMTTQVFEPNGVDLVLSGHNHFYQHNLVNGIHHMVLGSIGAPLYTPGSADYTVLSETTVCFGIFETTPEMLTLTTYREDGSVIEVIEIPEPATLSLVLIGGLVLLKRTRKSGTGSSQEISGDHYMSSPKLL